MQSSALNSSPTSMRQTSRRSNSDSGRAARNSEPQASTMRPNSRRRTSDSGRAAINPESQPSSTRPTSVPRRDSRNQEPPNDDLLKVKSELKPEPFEISYDTDYINMFRTKNPDVFFDTSTIFKNKCTDFRLMLPVFYWDIFEIKLDSYREKVESFVNDKIIECLEYLNGLKNSPSPSLEPEPRTHGSVSANPNLKLFNYCTVYDFIESCIKDNMRYTENEDSELGTTGNYQKNQLGDLKNYIANTKYYLAGYSEHINKYLFDYVTDDAHFTRYFNNSNRNITENELLNTYKRELLNVIFLNIFLEHIKTELKKVGVEEKEIAEIDKYATCIEKSKMLKEFNMMVDDNGVIDNFGNIDIIINYFKDHRDFDIGALKTYECSTSGENVLINKLMTNPDVQFIKRYIKEQHQKVSSSLGFEDRQMMSFIHGPLYNSD